MNRWTIERYFFKIKHTGKGFLTLHGSNLFLLTVLLVLVFSLGVILAGDVPPTEEGCFTDLIASGEKSLFGKWFFMLFIYSLPLVFAFFIPALRRPSVPVIYALLLVFFTAIAVKKLFLIATLISVLTAILVVMPCLIITCLVLCCCSLQLHYVACCNDDAVRSALLLGMLLILLNTIVFYLLFLGILVLLA